MLRYEITEANAAPCKPQIGIKIISRITVSTKPTNDAHKFILTIFFPEKYPAITLVTQKGIVPKSKIQNTKYDDENSFP